MDGTVRFFESLGLPGLLAWAVLLIEAAAGIALILGLRTRLATLAAFPLLLGGGAHALADDEAAS
jgi:putative oxidoreductase